MKAQFDHNLLSSFYLWFENRLLKEDTKAYITNLNNTFKYVDFNDIPSDMYGYQGQFRQLVADHSVDVVNSGFFSSGTFITGDSDQNGGILVDYNNGRILVPQASGKALTLTANSTVKEVNVYISNDSDLELILNSDFIENGQSTPYFYTKDSQLDEQVYFLPACFISIASSENKEFAFGGEEDTNTRIRVLVLTQDNFILDSILSRFRDTVRSRITHVPYEDFPYGYSYSIKNFPYQYNTLINSQPDNIDKSFVQKVNTSKIVSSSLRDKLNKNFSIGFIDFDLSTYRFPRL